jgi:hypothetical protein
VSAGPRFARIASLAALGALTGRHLGSAEAVFAGALAGLILGEASVWVLRALLQAGNVSVRTEHDVAVVRTAVDEGFLMLLPFAVLALVAELGLGWNSVQAFAAAGLLTAGGLAGSAMTAQGGSAFYNAVIPMLLMAAAVTGWAWLAAAANVLGAP